VTQQLQKQGVDVTGLEIENGSGLARDTAVSANGLTTMMQEAWNSPVMPEFLSSLALLGNDGTMRNRLKSPETRLRAHMKTGALRDVRAAAGYVLGKSGKRYIMVSMVNHNEAYRARAFENEVIAWLIKN
ncbi:MAG: D-alanyl-D-alanine carboxypeptidase, partial [Burkholderiaceae bacterium]|nr:D-alanyl-D-alanine carboxypeptidase [Burkholderiaceae bacterium]